MVSKVKRSLLALSLLVCAGCPPLHNSVIIQNDAASTFYIIGVSIGPSGTLPVFTDLSGDPIVSSDEQGFCCFIDGLYDIFVMADGGSNPEQFNVNQNLDGPQTHLFTFTFQ